MIYILASLAFIISAVLATEPYQYKLTKMRKLEIAFTILAIAFAILGAYKLYG